MTRETIYDDIHDAQRHFRVVLDAMARPGRIQRLATVDLSPPPPLTRGAAWIAFALLNTDVSCYFAPAHTAAAAYLQLNTSSRAAEADAADFLFLRGDASAEPLTRAPLGIPAYPEGGATAVVMVDAMGKSSARGGLALTLTGPGIETRDTVCIDGLSAEFLEVRHQRNEEFPLGIDFIFVTADGQLVCLPRTTRVEWTVL